MAIEEHVAFGTILAYGDGAQAEVFTKIGQLKDISGPNMSRDTIDVTNHDSPGGFREFLASVRDGGEITFAIEYDPGDATHDQDTGLLYLFGLNVRTNFQLIFPVASGNGFWGYEFSGVVTGFSPKEPVEGSITADITIKVGGAVTLVDDLQVPVGVTPSALALSSSTPDDDAITISKTADLVVVFNNRLAANAEWGLVLATAVGVKVVLTPTVSTDRKTVTLAHASLAGTTLHLLSYGMVDVYGQHLEGIVSFTTTS
jgi:predicted secreted protein